MKQAKDTLKVNAQVEIESLPTHQNGGMLRGLAQLWQAYGYARDTGANLWDFALEIDKLFESGMTISDLRWLIYKGFVNLGRETSSCGDNHRSFHLENGFKFDQTSCLILTPEGAKFANHFTAEFGAIVAPAFHAGSIAGSSPAQPAPLLNVSETNGKVPVAKPHWNSERRELWLSDTVVKRFRVPARNQETILSAFEAEAWPEHIDDPLPSNGVDPQSRLHDAIYRLNQRQTNQLLRFRGNGNADGVIWELVSSDK